MDRLLHRKLIFKLALLLFLALPIVTKAQKSFWKGLVPDQANLQYAGSIGFLSAGAGYNLMKEKTALSFHVGYVPESLGGELTIVAIKFEYKPWAIHIKDKAIIHPFNPVIFPSYTLGENFDFKFERPQYRKGYYFWSSALRLHIGAGTEIKLLTKPNSKIKYVSVYAEANTNDLYLLSWYQNRTNAPFYKMFKLGYGIRTYF